MLEVITKQQAGLITFNYEEIKQQLEVELKKYDVVVTEESIKEAKELKANLNKIKNKVEDERKRIKKEYCQPLTDFEAQVKDLVTLLDASYKKINDQVAAFDEKKKAERKEEIKQEYELNGISKIIPFETFFEKEWLNSSFSKKVCSEEITRKIAKIEQDMSFIKMFQPKDIGDAKQVQMLYIKTLDVGLAKSKADELIELRKKVVQENLEPIQHEAVQPIVQQTPTSDFTIVTFQVKATHNQLVALNKFLKENNILVKKLEG